MVVREKAKTPESKGTDEITPPTNEEKVIIPPEAEKGQSGKQEPELSKTETVKSLTQKYNTLLGQHKKLQKDHTELEGKASDFQGISQKIDILTGQMQEHGVTLTLLTDIISAGAEYNEDLQVKIKKAREDNEAKQAKAKEAMQVIANLNKKAVEAGITLQDERLKPAKDFWDKGKIEEAGAVGLTIIKLIKDSSGGVKFAKAEPTTEPPKKPVEKGKLTQIMGSPGVSRDVESLSPREKIIQGRQERLDQA